MIAALRAAGSGLLAQQTALEVVGNNLANVTTPGFKRSRANFQDAALDPNAEARALAPAVRGVLVRDIQRLDTPGTFEATGNPLDLAIAGAGFFTVTRPDGTTAYTRDGTFQLDASGRLLTPTGDVLTGVQLPAGASSLRVASDGSVTAFVGGTPQPAGQITLAVFPNPGGLLAAGSNLFLASEASGAGTLVPPGTGGAGELAAGVRELSNVSLADEMVSLLVARRAYAASVRAVQTLDEMVQGATNLSA